MTSSQMALQLRQRGVAIAGGGLVLMLIGVLIGLQGGPAAITLIPLAIAASAVVRSYTSVKDRTSQANTWSVITVIVAFVTALVISSPLGGVIIIVIGAVVGFIGNKQLAAGIKA